MKNKFYSEKNKLLFDEANDICNKLYNPIEGCTACDYVDSGCCKIECLQENYNIISKKTLQLLNLDNYDDTHNTCLVFPCPTYKENPEINCYRCLLETLIKDPHIMFIKKENK